MNDSQQERRSNADGKLSESTRFVVLHEGFSEGDARPLLSSGWEGSPDRGRPAIRLVGRQSLDRVGDVAALCLEVGLPDVDIVVDSDARALVDHLGVLERACRIIGDSGIAVALALCGIGGVSRAPTGTLRGLSPLDVLAALRDLVRLWRDHPAALRFRPDGYWLLLDDPNASLEDLAFDLRVVREAGLEPFSGRLFTAGEADPGFEDPRMAPVARTLLRFAEPEARLSNDELTHRAHRVLRAGRERGMGLLDVALTVVEDVLRRGLSRERSTPVFKGVSAGDGFLPLTPEVLIERGRTLVSAKDPREVPSPKPLHEQLEEKNVRWHAALCREGIKPAAKIAFISKEAARAAVDLYELPNPRFREVSDDVCDLFFGEDRGDVDLIVEMNSHLRTTQKSHQSPHDQMAVLKEVGRLYGYPICCVKKWAVLEEAGAPATWAWMHLLKRVENPGPVDPALRPWCGHLEYVPCSLDCAPTLALLPRIKPIFEEVFPPDSSSNDEARMVNPWLVLLRGAWGTLELIPRDPPGERFTFNAGQVGPGLEEPDLRLASQADEVVLEPERLMFYRRGRLHVDLSATAYVWWHRRALQEEFWSHMVTMQALTAAPAK